MKALSIRFDEKTYESLRQNSEVKSVAMAEYTRKLVEIGLRVEAAISKKSDKINKGQLKKLWEKELSWTLETRFLARLLVKKMLASDDESNVEFMREARIKAGNFVAGMLDNGLDEG